MDGVPRLRHNRKDTMKIATANVLSRREDFTERIPAILDNLLRHSPDIILLQEVPDEHERTIKNLFREWNYGYAQRRTLVLNRRDTVGIAWNRATIDNDMRITEIGNVDALALEGYIKPDGDAVTLPKVGNENRQDDRVEFIVMSYHGAWGSLNQYKRLREVETLNDWAYRASHDPMDPPYADEGSSVPVFLGGDFNATDDERTIKYMLGQEPGSSPDNYAYWTEVQNEMYALQGGIEECRPVPTSFTDGCAAHTGREHGIDMNYMPARRIDYVMSLGYGHGRPYGFKRVDIIKKPLISDHAFIIADTIGLSTVDAADDGITNEIKAARANTSSEDLDRIVNSINSPSDDGASVTDLAYTGNHTTPNPERSARSTDESTNANAASEDTGTVKAEDPSKYGLDNDFDPLTTPPGFYDGEAVDYATVIANENPFLDEEDETPSDTDGSEDEKESQAIDAGTTENDSEQNGSEAPKTEATSEESTPEAFSENVQEPENEPPTENDSEDVADTQDEEANDLQKLTESSAPNEDDNRIEPEVVSTTPEEHQTSSVPTPEVGSDSAEESAEPEPKPITIDENNLGDVSDEGKTDTRREQVVYDDAIDVNLDSSRIDSVLEHATLYKVRDSEDDYVKALVNPWSSEIVVTDAMNNKHYGSKSCWIVAMTDENGDEPRFHNRFIMSAMEFRSHYTHVSSNTPGSMNLDSSMLMGGGISRAEIKNSNPFVRRHGPVAEAKTDDGTANMQETEPEAARPASAALSLSKKNITPEPAQVEDKADANVKEPPADAKEAEPAEHSAPAQEKATATASENYNKSSVIANLPIYDPDKTNDGDGMSFLDEDSDEAEEHTHVDDLFSSEIASNSEDTDSSNKEPDLDSDGLDSVDDEGASSSAVNMMRSMFDEPDPATMAWVEAEQVTPQQTGTANTAQNTGSAEESSAPGATDDKAADDSTKPTVQKTRDGVPIITKDGWEK